MALRECAAPKVGVQKSTAAVIPRQVQDNGGELV